jgi:hypothetical protein
MNPLEIRVAVRRKLMFLTPSIKMNILIIDIDSKIPNLALKKIEKYHLDRGDKVTWNFPLARYSSDKIYVSCVFTKNKAKCREWEGVAEIGGTGYDIYKKLPPEIEEVKPRINWGFTTRGCIRKCEFCFVPAKEGHIRVVGDIYDIWDGKSRDLTIMDNNILALPKHFAKICDQLRKEKIRVDFNQGLDIRLLTDDMVNELKSIRHKEYKFSWDNLEWDLEEKFRWLYQNLGRCTIFVLCGFKTSFEDDLKKFEILRKIGHNGYCMRYETVYRHPKYIKLARWVNQHHIFHPFSFKEFIEADKKYHRDFIEI